MNRKDELNEENEIDSYELNDDDFSKNLNQYARNSTLLMDRYGNESPDEMDQSFFKNRKLSTDWLVDTQEKSQQQRPPDIEEDEESFITELDVNSDISQRKLSTTKDDESLPLNTLSNKSRKSIIKSKSNIINDLPILLDEDDNLNNENYLPISKNVLSLQQLDNITKKDDNAFMLDNINLSFLSKYLIKDASSNQIESDLKWTYDSLITEMANNL